MSVMITDCYDIKTEQVISLEDFYGKQKHILDLCLIVFSKEIHGHFLNTFECEEIGELTACNGKTPISYKRG